MYILQDTKSMSYDQKFYLIILIASMHRFQITRTWIPKIYEPVHEISNNVVCATSKASDQPAHTRSLIRAFASRLSTL